MSKILEALAKLDVANDAHWTEDSLPRLESVRFFAGDQALDRAAVTAAAPSFNRATPVIPVAVLGGGSGSDPISQVKPEVTQASFAEALANARASVLATREAKRQADQNYAKANEALDVLVAQGERDGPHDPLHEQLRGYFGSQRQLLADRADKIKALRGFGAENLKELLRTKAPIDAAMARKTARGVQRPKQL